MKKIIFYMTLLFVIAIVITSKFNSGENKSTNYVNNACSMLKENPDWYLSLKSSEEKWKTPIHIQLGMIRQESAFKHDAKPKRENKWHEFGSNYQSSAVGYSQALNGTWDHYLKNTQSILKDRQSFKDATDFIGWYNDKTNKKNKIAFNDPKGLYLNYHEGWRGYKKKSYEEKHFLKKASSNVVNWSKKYKEQLKGCKLTGEPDMYFMLSVYADYLVIGLGYLWVAIVFIAECLFSVVTFIYHLLV